MATEGPDAKAAVGLPKQNLEQRDLLSATQKGDANTIRKVLHGHQVNPDIKIKNAGEERSPLHIACGYGQDNVVAELLKAGADPCAVSSSGRTPLHDACQGGHLECVELLANFDVDLDSQDKDGMSPLHIAAFQGELKCFKALAEKGADLTIINAKGQEPIHLAVVRNHVDIVKYMFEKSVDLETQCFQGKQPLHYAAQHGSLESLIALVERNCDIDIGDNNGCVPAHLAAKTNQVDCLRFLVKQGCTMDMTQAEGKTFAHMAAQNGSSKCLHWLLEKGVDPNLKDGFGNTAGHSAAEKGHGECFNCYVQHSGSLDALNDRNETPLQSGRRFGAPVKLQKAIEGALQCPQCIAKNKRLDWEFAHRPSAVEAGIMKSGQVAYTNPVSADKRKKNKKLEPPLPGSAKGRESQASNVSNLFLTQNYMPVRDISTKFYGQHLGGPGK